jgi:hypothetical protein
MDINSLGYGWRMRKGRNKVGHGTFQAQRENDMNNGNWLKPPGARIRHFILTPAVEALAQRHSACGRVFLLGIGDYASSKAKRCEKCLRLYT